VTNSQFGQFITARGYHSENWWSSEGWQLRQENNWTCPRFWEDNHQNNPNHPVVGVSWYEAEAFCNWLSSVSGQKYRLPTEREWERLARGKDGWEYPWGEKWRGGVSNSEIKLRQTSAVGIFPTGISPTGAYDCAGNVWEWCTDWYDEEKKTRVLRGGSWNSDRYAVSCTYRGMNDPGGGHNGIGFRVVVSIA
jgi:formylglycine-generating enzyme required for sulfatase activity